jgi:hypothetical protein
VDRSNDLPQEGDRLLQIGVALLLFSSAPTGLVSFLLIFWGLRVH